MEVGCKLAEAERLFSLNRSSAAPETQRRALLFFFKRCLHATGLCPQCLVGDAARTSRAIARSPPTVLATLAPPAGCRPPPAAPSTTPAALSPLALPPVCGSQQFVGSLAPTGARGRLERASSDATAGLGTCELSKLGWWKLRERDDSRPRAQASGASGRPIRKRSPAVQYCFQWVCLVVVLM